MLKNIRRLCVATLLLSSMAYGAEPYDSVRLITAEPYFVENGYVLVSKVNSLGATVFIDVESPNGGVSRLIASYTDESVRVYSVNAWSGEHEYHQFLSNVRQENTGERITPLRMNSEDASDALNLSANLIFIDSSDSTTLPPKIASWLTHVADGGAIVGNNWQWNDVKVAVTTAALELNLSLTLDTNYWFLSRP